MLVGSARNITDAKQRNGKGAMVRWIWACFGQRETEECLLVESIVLAVLRLHVCAYAVLYLVLEMGHQLLMSAEIEE